MTSSTLTTFLSFDGLAAEASRFYVDLFGGTMTRVGPLGGDPNGPQVADFEILGKRFVALDVGPMFTPSPAISLMVHVEGQAEIDRIWNALEADGGKPLMCGWITDRFGVTWQVTPKFLDWVTRSDDTAGTARVMEVLTKMVKLDEAKLREAYEAV